MDIPAVMDRRLSPLTRYLSEALGRPVTLNIAVSRKVDNRLFGQIQRAFLALDIMNPKHRSEIEALDPEYDGFAATRNEEYSVVRNLIAPFEAGK
jgi:ABC-type phosphate/phosphonate transport system substrate-binding protein